MKIGLNATCFNMRPSGAKHRFLGIYRHLFELLPNAQFLVYQPKDFEISKCFFDRKNVKFITLPVNSRSRYLKFLIGLMIFPKIFKKEKFDIFESFNFPLIRGKSEYSILTIHDIRGLNHQSNILLYKLYKLAYFFSIRRADRIITVSYSMKEEIHNSFSYEEKISVIYNGISRKNSTKNFKLKDLRNAIPQIPDNFILSVGHFEARKNYPKLISAMKILKTNGLNLNLITVGNDSGKKSEIRDQIEKLNLHENVILLDAIEDSILDALYRHAELFVFPSYYEGFGIPILESLDAGTPVLLSNIKVFKEITKNIYHTNYFDPEDPIDIAEKIEQTLLRLRSKSSKEKISVPDEFEYKVIAKNLKDLYIKVIK